MRRNALISERQSGELPGHGKVIVFSTHTHGHDTGSLRARTGHCNHDTGVRKIDSNLIRGVEDNWETHMIGHLHVYTRKARAICAPVLVVGSIVPREPRAVARFRFLSTRGMQGWGQL